MFTKDTFRLIKTTFNRFFSLLMMVLIGVAFMMGLMSSKAVMKESVDKYADDSALHDFQIYSTFGFDEDDIKAIKSLSCVDKVFASKTIDCFFVNNGKSTCVARVEEVDRNIGKINLTSGRLPEKENEIVVYSARVEDTRFALGDSVELFLEDSDLGDSLSCLSYTIVGFAESPCYISKVLGVSNLKNQDLSVICYIQNENFIADYYTCIYATCKGASEFISYTEEYIDYVKEQESALTDLAHVQQSSRKDKIVEEAIAKLEEGKETLEKEKIENQKKLDDAKKKLDDAYREIRDGEKELEANQKLLADKEQVLLDGEKELLEGEKVLLENKKQLSDAIALVESSDSEGRSFDEIYSELETSYNAYKKVKDAKNSVFTWAMDLSSDERDVLSKMLGSLGYSISGTLNSILDLINGVAGVEIEETYKQLTQIKEGMALIEENEKVLEENKDKIADGKKQIADAKKQLADAKEKLDDGKEQYYEGLKEYNEGLEEFNLKIADAEAEIADNELKIAELSDAEWIVLDRESNYSSVMFTQNSDQMGKIGVALPILFFLVAALVCTTTMTRLIDEQRGQIGVLRALGYSNAQIRGKYVFYAFLASICGAIPGIVIGMALFPTVIYNTWRLLYHLPEMQLIIKPEILVFCIVAFSALMCIVSAIVADRSLKEMPSELMRPKAPKSTRPVFLEKIKFIWNKLSFTGKITARNIIRYKSRFFMTVLGVAGCTALLVVGWGVKDSISEIVDIQFGEIFSYEYSVYVEEDADISRFTEVLDNADGAIHVSPFMEYSSKLYDHEDDQTMYVQVMTAADANAVLSLRDEKGNPLKLSDNGVIVSSKFAEKNKIKVGDTIVIESSTGRRAGVQVLAICEMYFQHYVFMSDEYYEEVFKQKAVHTVLAVLSNSNKSPATLVKDIEGYISTVNFDSMIAQFQTMLEALDYIILVIIVTAGALAFVVLVNLTQVNISERIREIATLKVLGFRPGEVNSYLFKEIFGLSLIGGALGLPLGVVFHHFIMNIISMDMVKFGMNIKPLSFTYSFGITIAFTIIVLQLTKKSLHNIKMVESLKSVE